MADIARVPGRPRKPGVDDAVLTAMVDLVTERGYGRTTIDTIARRAGVAKTTIYRRWRSEKELAIDALVRVLGEPPMSHSSGEAAVRDAISWLAARIPQEPVPGILIGLLAEAAHDPEVRTQLRTKIREPFVTQLVSQWDLAPAAADTAFDIVVGGLLHRLATTGDIDTADTETVTSAATNLLFHRDDDQHRRG